MSIKILDTHLVEWLKEKKVIKEATGTSGSGSFKAPLTMGTRLWDKENLDPFTIQVSKYDDSQLAFDSYDGSLDVSKKTAKKLESKSRKIEKKLKKNPSISDNDGDNLNGGNGPGNPVGPFYKIVKESDLVNEATTTTGDYTGPLVHGFRKWRKTSLSPFDIEAPNEHTYHSKKNKLDDIIVHHIRSITEESINEDLGVWFGTKKKPKGSKQPKGPWVNICRKKEGGGHPPCGRPDASDKGYPKCRAAGVASKMTDSQKKSACQQKRKAEKSHNKSGTGNSPKMTHYEPKKESIRDIIQDVLNEKFK